MMIRTKILLIFLLIIILPIRNFSQWKQINSPDSQVYTIGISGANLFASTKSGGVFRSGDNGNSWEAVNNGFTSLSYIESLAICNNTLLAGTGSGPAPGGVFLSINNGDNWIKVTSDSLNKAIYCFAIKDSFALAGGWLGSVLYSTNSGKKWKPISIKQTFAVVRALAFSESAIFAGTDPDGVFRSVDTGKSWTQTGLSRLGVMSFVVKKDTIYVGTYGGGMFISTNEGNDWEQINIGLTNKKITCLIDVDGNLLAGTTNAGVFLLKQNSLSWVPVDSGFTNSDVTGFAVSDSEIFVSTWGDGIWCYSRSALLLLTSFGACPRQEYKGFSLRQNYPNPFNPSTTISYTLPEDGRVQIKVFDILGREVTTLLDKFVNSGQHTLVWDASNLASGAYFCTITFKNQTLKGKMLLLR